MTASRSLPVPKAMKPTYEAVVALSDAVCHDHLDADYRDLARAMAAALARKRPSPLASGQPRTWACGIVYALGQLNFLTDKGTEPYLSTPDLCAAFGVGQSTALAKSRVIFDTLGANRLDVQWMLPSRMEDNPLIWTALVNGIMVDLRDMPREVQAIAFEQGLIPYIPADER